MSQKGSKLIKGLSLDVYFSFEFCVLIVFFFFFLTNGNVAQLRTHNGDE